MDSHVLPFSGNSQTKSKPLCLLNGTRCQVGHMSSFPPSRFAGMPSGWVSLTSLATTKKSCQCGHSGDDEKERERELL